MFLGRKVPRVDEEREVCTLSLTLCPSKLKTLLDLSKKKDFDYLAKVEFIAGYTILAEKCLGWTRNAKFVLRH